MQFNKAFYESEIREGFFVPSIVKRCWAAQLQILDDVKKICEKHDIKYYMNWGSLIGTVRHGGYIPWDDDLDISMLREDYQKFYEVWQKEEHPQYDLLNCYDKDYYQLILRPCTASQIPLEDDLYDYFHGFPYLAGIDIFPLDYMSPEKEREAQNELLDYAFNCAYGFPEFNREDKKAAAKHLEKMTRIKIDFKKDVHRQVFAIFDRCCSMYKAKDSEYVTQMTHYLQFRNVKQCLISTKAFETPKTMLFEGMEVSVPNDYHEVLTMEYHDYMRKIRGGAGHNYPYFLDQEEAVEEAGAWVVPKLKFEEKLLARANYVPTANPVLPPKQAKRIVILSHRADRWNAVKSIYDAAAASDNCEILVYAIPYFVRQRDGVLTDMEYHPDQYPEDVPVIDYQQAKLQDLDADVIIYQTPYDDNDINNCIHPDYFVEDLQASAPEVIYVPDFMTYDFENKRDWPAYYNMRFYVLSPGCVQADHIIVQSEKARENYIMKLTEFAGEETKARWEERVLALGNPMQDDATLEDPEGVYPKKPELCGDRTVGQTILDWILTGEIAAQNDNNKAQDNSHDERLIRDDEKNHENSHKNSRENSHENSHENNQEDLEFTQKELTETFEKIVLNPRKFAFIICSNDKLQVNEAVNWISQLDVPNFYEVELFVINDAESMLKGMQEGRDSTDAKYKIFMHQDVAIVNKMFLHDVLKIFKSDDEIGMIGMIGAKELAADGVMWHKERVGNMYQKGFPSDYSGYYYEMSDGMDDVAVVDGFMMITQHDVPLREDLFDGWDFYDVSTALEYRRAGYRVVVPRQLQPWCVHDDGVVLTMWNYDKYRKIAIEEYASEINNATGCSDLDSGSELADANRETRQEVNNTNCVEQTATGNSDDFSAKMQELASKKDKIIERATLMEKFFQMYLENPTPELEKHLVQFFITESDDAVFSKIGEMKKLQTVVEIVLAEKAAGIETFIDGLESIDEVYAKYQLSIMSLRHIELGLDDDFVFEGVQFLIENAVSPKAVEILLNYIYISDENKVWTVMNGVWDEIASDM